MALLDYLEVDVQHSKSPFEEQERGTLFDASQTTSTQDYEWLPHYCQLLAFGWLRTTRCLGEASVVP